MVRKERGMTYQDFQKFLEVMPKIDSFTKTTAKPPMSVEKFVLMFKMMFYCGLRPEECSNLRKSDIDLDNRILLVKKSKFSQRERTTISPNLIGPLKDHINNLSNNDFLFTSKFSRKPLHRATTWNYAKKTGKVAGLKVFKPSKKKDVEGITLLDFRDSLEQYMKEHKVDKNLVDLKLRRKTDNNYGNKTDEDLKKWESKHYPRFFSEDEIKKHVNWYSNHIGFYYELSQKVSEIIEDIIIHRKIPFQDIQNREKELKKFEQKIRESVDYNPKDMEDLAGIRVICYTKSDVNDVCKVIEDTFDVDHKKLIDRSKKLGTTEMGYASFNFVATFTEDRINSAEELSDFSNKNFEIQVRTVLQHAWAEIEHDDLYKNPEKLSNEIRRRFYLVSSVLESADNELETLHRIVKSKKN